MAIVSFLVGLYGHYYHAWVVASNPGALGFSNGTEVFDAASGTMDGTTNAP